MINGAVCPVFAGNDRLVNNDVTAGLVFTSAGDASANFCHDALSHVVLRKSGQRPIGEGSPPRTSHVESRCQPCFPLPPLCPSEGCRFTSSQCWPPPPPQSSGRRWPATSAGIAPAVTGRFAVACSNIEQDFSRLRAGESAPDYWEGNPPGRRVALRDRSAAESRQRADLSGRRTDGGAA